MLLDMNEDYLYSLIYIELGNPFSFHSTKYDSYFNSDGEKLGAYLNFLIRNVEVLKIDLKVMNDTLVEQFEPITNVDVRCLCYVRNQPSSNNVPIPHKYVIGAVDLFTHAGQKIFLIDEEEARKIFLNDYVYKNIYKKNKHFNFSEINNNYFNEDWHIDAFDAEILDANSNNYKFATNFSETPKELGFYNWLFKEITIGNNFDKLIKDPVFNQTELKFSEKGIWFNPISEEDTQ
jgi:hypothetical protein